MEFWWKMPRWDLFVGKNSLAYFWRNDRPSVNTSALSNKLTLTCAMWMICPLFIRHWWMSDTWHLYERTLHQLWGLLPLWVPTGPGYWCRWESVCGHTHEDHLLWRHKDGHMLAAVPWCSDQIRVLLCQSWTWLWRTLPTLPLQKLR